MRQALRDLRLGAGISRSAAAENIRAKTASVVAALFPDLMGQALRGVRPAMVDTHVHFWKFAQLVQPGLRRFAAFHRDMLWPDYLAAIAGAPVERVVHVQVEEQDPHIEAQFIAGEAAVHPEIAAMTGWAPLDLPDSRSRVLEQLATNFPLVVGSKLVVRFCST